MLVLLLILLGLIGWLGVELILVVIDPEVDLLSWYAAMLLLVWAVGGIARGFYETFRDAKEIRARNGHITVSKLVEGSCGAIVFGFIIGLPILIHDTHSKLMNAKVFVKKKPEP